MKLSLFLLLVAVGAGAQEQRPNCPTPPAGEQKPWLNAKYSPECRAQFVLEQLPTVEDKFEFLNSARMFRGPSVPDIWAKLGLKHGGGSDGPAGVRHNHTATAFPTPLSISASFDPTVAAKYGDLEGQEFYAAGISTDLGPAMDIARTWHFGRVTESWGEDPFLAGSMVAPEIRGIQSHHVEATMKHFAVYGEEQNRAGDDPDGLGPGINELVSERALREIYFPAFHAAVTKGGVADVMCSFPRINGVYACENPYTLGVLKREWGFQGTVGPDFPDAQRSIVPAFKAGLDSGIMAPPPLNGYSNGTEMQGSQSLRAAVDEGEISVGRINDIIRRRLVIPFRIGVFDNPWQTAAEVSTPERRAAAVPLIDAGAVLLKDDGDVLPFGPNVKSVAIIGTQATDKAIVTEQGSPHVEPNHLAPVLAAVQQRAGSGVQISFAPGTLGLRPLPMLPASYFKTPDGKPGVQAEYYANPDRNFSGRPMAVRTEPSISLDQIPDIPGIPPYLHWSVRYIATFTPDKTGIQHFTMVGSGEAVLYIDHKQVAEYMRSDMQDLVYANVEMTAGKPVEIRVEFTPREAFGVKGAYNAEVGTFLGPKVELGWSEPNDLMQQAAEAASKADVAVVFVGHKVGEGMDRLSLELPDDQDALIEAVAKANPHTVVVLNTGGAVLMPWLDKVSAVLETWLPGDSDGPATARLLFGDANPGGRLPVTFPASMKQGPGSNESEYPGILLPDGSLQVHFDEGIFVGYRYWDEYGQRPLFPFGYGLSYTSFAWSGESVKTLPDGGAEVSVTVKNTGQRAGSDVVQVYVGFPQGVGEPPRQLKGFQKVELGPGEQKTVQITLDPHAFQFWDEPVREWNTAQGAYQIIVGKNEQDTQWQGTITPQVQVGSAM